MYVCMDRTARVGIRRAGCRICDREYVFPRPFLISCLDVVLIGWGERELLVRPSVLDRHNDQSKLWRRRGRRGAWEERGSESMTKRHVQDFAQIYQGITHT